MPITFSALAYVFALAVLPSFETWMGKYGRNYNNVTEYKYRRDVYNANLEKIARHNSEGHTWSMDVNNFADLTANEFRTRYAGCTFNRPVNNTFSLYEYDVSALPSSVDWSTKGAVTPIKNQQQCGSCWAFSTTGSVEGAHFLAGNKLVSLSEQQLVDCSGAEGNQGCNGGLMDYAFQYIIDNKGITSEANYPYTAADGTCNKQKASQVVATISSYKDVPTNSESALMAAVAQQPVSVAVEADQSVFQFYSGGVMTSSCGTNLDHGVLAVGYGTEGGQDYWKVKNSWGADWGMQGYILLGRGSQYGGSGQCGIQMQPSYPVV